LPSLKLKATRERLIQNVTKLETERSISRRPRRTEIELFVSQIVVEMISELLDPPERGGIGYLPI
jgi:hypothetical protein